MLAGRFIFGLGGECQFVCKSAIISQWFKGKELAFAFGMNLSFSRLGSVAASFIEPRLASDNGGDITIPLYVGLGFCVFSFFCGIGIVVVDAYADKVDGVTAKLTGDDKFKCSDLKSFTLPYWLITFSCVVIYCCIFPYTWNTATMLNDEFAVPVNTASTLYSLPFFISAGLAPPLGYFIDKVGHRALFSKFRSFLTFFCLVGGSSLLVMFSCILTIVLVIMTFTGTNYICLAPLITLGIAYSIYASALWPSIPFVVPPPALGSAFGLITCF